MKQIQKIVESAIADKLFPGCAVGVIRKNGERSVVSSPVVKEDSIFDIASIGI